MAQAKLRALQQWCKNRCEGYHDVKITNMTTSWRDGLAFCALIHRFRPDLINFESLCKENVYYNNHLAFSVAEHLGITALLEAKDMEDLAVPDKLSIITYVASLYNYFKDKEKMGGPDIQKCKSHITVGMKRQPSSEIYEKFEPKRVAPNKAEERKKIITTPTKNTASGDYCVLCKDKVYLIEKHIEDGNLYHRSCFRKSYMSPTSKILTNHSTPKEIAPSAITINSINKTASKNLDSSKDDSSVTTSRLKGKLFDKKKDQIQKAEEKLRLEKQHSKEMETEQTFENRRKGTTSALKAHLKEIESKNLPINSVAKFESHNSEKPFQNPAYKGSNSKIKEVNDLTLSHTPAKSDKESESDSSSDAPKFMKVVTSQTMADKKMQATMYNKPVTNLKADNDKQQVVSGLLKSLAGVRHKHSASSTSSNDECPSPLPTNSTVSNTKLPQNLTSTNKSLSGGDNQQSFKNPHFTFDKNKMSLAQSTEKESAMVTAKTDDQNKHHSIFNSTSKSEPKSSNLMSTISNSSSSSVPKKNTGSAGKVQLPSILERIEQYSKVAPGVEIQPAEQSTNTKNETYNIKSNTKEPLAPSPKEPLAPSPKVQLAPSPKEPLAPSPKKPLAPSPKKPLAPSPKKPLAPSPKKPLAPSPKEPLAPSPKEPLAPSPKEPLAPSPKEPLAPSPKVQLAPSPKEPLAPSPNESFPLSTIMKNKQNLKQSQAIVNVPSVSVTTVTDKDKSDNSKFVKPHVLSKSPVDESSSHSQEKSSKKTEGKHLGNKDISTPVSGIVLTKLHPGHISCSYKGSSNVSTNIPYNDNRINPIPKPRREKICPKIETVKEIKENPSELKPSTGAHERNRTNFEHKAKEVKTEWQLEAERRIAARKDGYVDPEFKGFTVNNKSSQNTHNNEDINQDVKTDQKRRIPVTRTWTFNINSNLTNEQVTSPKSDVIKKSYTPEEIHLEVVDIDAKLSELELKGRQLEDLIRAKIDEDECDKGMAEWFHIINEKNELVRKENYLIYHLQEQDLLKKQSCIDEELQVILTSPGKRTKKIKKREKELIKNKIEVVNLRNNIVEVIEENRLRYQEEDQHIYDMLSKKGLVDVD